ncbi:cobalamin-binding protein [Chlorobium phaeovibrioides]|uniref:cobalamin-binding protein n=1 Tax=Chlorobium phaeovibrioides TaxID=1094 RepID=UPI000F81E67A|nr:cobalamin-binding protein [Chlorobium phaeovibrioides]RTY35048.1 cobalamin-binding protein [Chlorobium phaeovibrioides]
MHPKRSALPHFIFLLSLSFLLWGCGPGEKAAPERDSERPTVISLAPSITEMIYAIGAGEQLKGRTSACDWPKEAASVPVTGAFGRPSLEMLASLHPDLVIDVDLADETMGKKIEALGIRRETISCKTPEEIPDALKRIGRLTGHARQADSLASIIDQGLEKYRKKTAEIGHRPSIYLEIWDDPFWTGGRGSYTSALILYAGARNIGDAVEKEYFEISQEWVIRQNPEIIACMYMAKESSAADDVMNRPGWNHIDAVKNRRVYDRFDNSIFLRPGPRVLDGIEALYRLAHPESSPQASR